MTPVIIALMNRKTESVYQFRKRVADLCQDQNVVPMHDEED